MSEAPPAAGMVFILCMVGTIAGSAAKALSNPVVDVEQDGGCRNFPKSRRCAAAWSRSWRGRASPASRRGGRICAGRCRRISSSGSHGQTVTGLGRRAKYLLAELSSGEVLLMHLGMSGSFRVTKGDATAMPGDFHHLRSKAAAHDHVVFHMSSGATMSFNDPRRFGSMKLMPRHELDADPLMHGLGPEPLGNAFDAAMLAEACAGKKTSLKAALLDQRVVAGLGNIYVCEALHRARLSPKRSASTIAKRSGAAHQRADRAGGGHQDGPRRGHPGWRFVAARPPPHRRRAWLCSSTISRSTTAPASPAQGRDAAAP